MNARLRRPIELPWCVVEGVVKVLAVLKLLPPPQSVVSGKKACPLLSVVQ